MRTFRQVDVFTAEPYKGNPVAVVHDADGMSDEAMQQFAHWTNLSETTFLLEPTDPAADYRVRVFTPQMELPFAGHPTIGTCHAWLEAGGQPKGDSIIQECGLGLITLRRSDGRLSFAAPELIKGGPVSDEELAMVCAVLQLDRSEIVAAQWADNGPGWIAVMLESADAVLSIEPDWGAAEYYDIGVVGPSPLGVVGRAPAEETPAIEVRAFFRTGSQVAEDPVTGSLNAALAQWLLREARNGSAFGLTAPYVAAQGTAIGRAGRVYVEEAEGEVWVGGDAVTAVVGEVLL